MSDEQTAHHTKNEIIIVRRRGDEDHDGHHGGVWKIAYADFMTAMMAFFLVMWLINAANDQTRAAVASYFNPIKLVDQKPSDKGIKDDGKATKQGEQQEKTQTKGAATSTGDGADVGHQETSTAGEKTKYSEADYFENPYSVLSEIARDTGEKANVSSAGTGGAQTSGPATGASGGTAYRDPFDPDFWMQQVQTVPGKQALEKDIAPPVPGSTASGPGRESGKTANETTAGRPSEPGKAAAAAGKAAAHAQRASTDNAALSGSKTDVAAKAGPVHSGPAKATAAEVAAGGDKTVAATAEADKAKAEKLKAQIAKAIGGTVGTLAEGISVAPAKDGMLVSITDRVDDGMFNVGSAVPSHDMVVAMQKIGAVLSKRSGPVVIRGYTDARPFKGGGNDNWRLSTARAQSAYYMLVRGGLDKTRVTQISGFADHDLLLPDQPYAAANRRIEILVKDEEAEQ